jgi:hypothetical protein
VRRRGGRKPVSNPRGPGPAAFDRHRFHMSNSNSFEKKMTEFEGKPTVEMAFGSSKCGICIENSQLTRKETCDVFLSKRRRVKTS